MISKKDFVTITSIDGADNKRGTRLSLIDEALEDYALQVNATTGLKVQILYAIIKFCGQYLAAHKKKKGYFMQGTAGEHLQKTRNMRVEALLGDAETELKSLAPGIGRGLKVMMDAKAKSVRRTKDLAKGYSLERSIYMQYKAANLAHKRVPSAANPYSGSYIKDALSNSADFAFSDAAKKILKTDFKKLTPEQYRMIGTEAGGVIVKYYNKVARAEMLAIPAGGGRYEKVTGEPWHTDRYDPIWKRAVYFMYVIDHHGNLLVAEGPLNGDSQDKVAGFFNHSSFNAGRAVLCAGSIWIRDGYIRYLDNASGHYQPKTKDLKEALLFLGNEGGVDLTQVRTIDFADAAMNTSVLASGFVSGLRTPYPDSLKKLYGME